MNDEEEIIAAKEAIKETWLRRPGVTAMDVGVKYVGGKPTTDVAVRLFVRKKLAVVADADRFPNTLGKHKTDVIECEFEPAQLPDDSFYNPMAGGVRISCVGKGGTAGMFVRDNETNAIMILTTFHGDPIITIGSAVYQPASAPQPNGADPQIGYFAKNGHLLTPPVEADAVLFGAPRAMEFGIVQLGPVAGVRSVSLADMGLPIGKRGRTSGLTWGTLDGISGSYFDTADGRTYDHLLTFILDTAQSTTLMQPGDSGSVALDNSNRAVALMVACPQQPPFNYAMGTPIPLAMSALNVTPCIAGTPLPHGIVLTSTEVPTMPISHDHPPDYRPWGESVSGTVNIKPFPTCPVKAYKWTLTNVHQTLTFRASVAGFDQPLFSWRINGQRVNDFNTDPDAAVACRAMVAFDAPNTPYKMTDVFETVTVNASGQRAALYDNKGTYGELNINPSAVQGHIMLTVEVDVRDQHAGSSVDIPSKPAFATLDTQQLWYEEAYYRDRDKCANGAKVSNGLERHHFALIELLLAQPNPPPEVMSGLRFLAQLGMELEQLGREQPKSAQELTRIFAQTLNVPQQSLGVVREVNE